MAKRSRAAAARPERRKRRSPSPMQFSDELMADGRRRYEQTSEPLYLIAADFGIHRSTFGEMARKFGWVRHRPAPRELSAAARLLAQTERLEAEAMAALHAPATPADETPPGAPPDSIAASVEWLHRSLRGQIAAVEALRARAGAAPQTAHEAAVISRTLVALTGALHKLQRMASGPTQAGRNDDDEIPEDLDEFRDELARRIDAFVASRTDPRDVERDAAAPRVDAAGG